MELVYSRCLQTLEQAYAAVRAGDGGEARELMRSVPYALLPADGRYGYAMLAYLTNQPELCARVLKTMPPEVIERTHMTVCASKCADDILCLSPAEDMRYEITQVVERLWSETSRAFQRGDFTEALRLALLWYDALPAYVVGAVASTAIGGCSFGDGTGPARRKVGVRGSCGPGRRLLGAAIYERATGIRKAGHS